MFSATFRLETFDRLGNDEKLLPVLEAMCEALVRANLVYLTEHTPPRLYDAGISYRQEPPGEENWRDIPRILEVGHGDCEDLTCWRVAELRHAGIKAQPRASIHRMKDGSNLFHLFAQIWEPTASVPRIEDPSEMLGMK